jgi:hypothetical protein
MGLILHSSAVPPSAAIWPLGSPNGQANTPSSPAGSKRTSTRRWRFTGCRASAIASQDPDGGALPYRAGRWCGAPRGSGLSGSHPTRRWRETDSNSRWESNPRKTAAFRASPSTPNRGEASIYQDPLLTFAIYIMGLSKKAGAGDEGWRRTGSRPPLDPIFSTAWAANCG